MKIKILNFLPDDPPWLVHEGCGTGLYQHITQQRDGSYQCTCCKEELTDSFWLTALMFNQVSCFHRRNKA